MVINLTQAGVHYDTPPVVEHNQVEYSTSLRTLQAFAQSAFGAQKLYWQDVTRAGFPETLRAYARIEVEDPRWGDGGYFGDATDGVWT